MQRISRLSLALVITVAATGTASAGPLFQPAQSPAAPPQRVAAAQGGGGFLDFLFRGFGGPPRYEAPANYRQYPGEPADQAGRGVADPRFLKQEVSYDGREAPGTIIVDTRERLLYLVQGGGRAVRYGIGVGRPGFTWSGVHHISNKREWPDWTPPSEMLRRRPDLPRHMAGGPENPLGARAMYLGSTLYRIHGSNEPWTIGTQVSSGCIRMRNEDVIDLYGRVKVGAKVVVI